MASDNSSTAASLLMYPLTPLDPRGRFLRIVVRRERQDLAVGVRGLPSEQRFGVRIVRRTQVRDQNVGRRGKRSACRLGKRSGVADDRKIRLVATDKLDSGANEFVAFDDKDGDGHEGEGSVYWWGGIDACARRVDVLSQ